MCVHPERTERCGARGSGLVSRLYNNLWAYKRGKNTCARTLIKGGGLLSGQCDNIFGSETIIIL